MSRSPYSVAWLALAAASLVGALLSGGCGGGGGGSGGGSTSTGQASVALTDAPSDRLEAFEVDLASVELVLESGAVVSLPLARERVDLTELVTFSDLVAASQVPTGTYVGAILGLDLRQARVVIAGKASAARLVDPAGAPLSGLYRCGALFAGTQRLVIATGAQRHVDLDLDLDASCLLDDAANEVRLGPVLSASTSSAAAKPVRLRGSLAAVDSSARTLSLQPDTTSAPALLVRTTATTRFVVDGQAASIAALTTQPLGAGLVVHGQPETSTASFTATDVEAWTAPDVVTGVVVGRTAAGVLSLRGATVERSGGQRSAGQAVEVDATGAGVRVTRQGTTTALSLDEVGVGQRLVARGALSSSTLDVRGSGGHLVLVETPLFGYATGPASAGNLTVNLARIAGRPIADFDFAVDLTTTANPAAFVVNVSGLSTSTIGADTPVALRTQVSAWTAAAGQPDAVASQVSDQAALATVLRADWQAPTATPFLNASSTALRLDLQTSQRRSLDQGLATSTPLLASDEPTVVPAGSTGLYRIVDQDVTTLHDEFDEWLADLTQRLSAGARVRTFTAVGRWDGTTGVTTLTARSASAVIE
jgi:hypothetical protein